MDILTQYYNDAGQIIGRIPDLATREFYRDHMFRHRFDEMFVATPQQVGPVCSTVSGYRFYSYGGGSGDSVPAYTNDAIPLELVNGRDGRKALLCGSTATTQSYHVGIDGSNDNLNAWLGTFGVTQDISFGLLFRSPNTDTSDSHSPGLSISFTYLNTNDDSRGYTDTSSDGADCTLGFGFYKKYLPGVANAHIEFSAIPGFSDTYTGNQVAASYLYDGAWHFLETKCYLTGRNIVSIDGTTLYDFSFGTSIKRFYRPYINVALYGSASEFERYAIDTGWIKAI